MRTAVGWPFASTVAAVVREPDPSDCASLPLARSPATLAGFPEYDARRVLRCNKQLEAGVLAHAARTFTEGAEQQQWARWGGAGGGGGGPGATGQR